MPPNEMDTSDFLKTVNILRTIETHLNIIFCSKMFNIDKGNASSSLTLYDLKMLPFDRNFSMTVCLQIRHYMVILNKIYPKLDEKEIIVFNNL